MNCNHRVDHLLEGGLQSGTITEIYGHPGSGKTQLVLQVSAYTSLRQRKSTAYLSTSHLCVKHLLRIMHSFKKEVNPSLLFLLSNCVFQHSFYLSKDC